MKNNNVLLSIENISKSYNGNGIKVYALKETSFELHQGEFIAIMGTSGSGKSTLLNVIGALDEPDSGNISLNGQVIKDFFMEPNATQYRSENIGFVFQSFNLLKDLTVEDNIALPLILRDVAPQEIESKVCQLLKATGLTEWRKHRPVQLSGGQQQRVAIARALITSPPIILADEPTGNLDFNTTTEILQVLVNMKETFNQSILLVTHDPYVATYADRVLFFHDGQMVDEYRCSSKESNMDNILKKFKRIMVISHDKVT